jgi:hypothetical protein
MSEETKLDKIYTKYKELKEIAIEDCKFDKSKMDDNFTTTNSKIWWINKKSEWSRVYRELERQRKDQYKTTYEFYYKDFPIKLNSKEEYTLYIESDPSYLNIFTICLVVKEVLQYIDSILDILKDRQWEIKNYLTYLQFSNGL